MLGTALFCGGHSVTEPKEMEAALHKPIPNFFPLSLSFFIPCSQAAKTTKSGLQIYIS